MKPILAEADELLPMSSGSDTLVLHIDDRSTDFLGLIYEGKGYDVLNDYIPSAKLEAEIKSHSKIFMLGHGGPGGLFFPGFDPYRMAGLLAEKTGVYIWCHAVEYAHKCKLTGLVSGMFISEVGEARYNDIEATQAQVTASNEAFSMAVRHYLDTGSSPHEVKNRYSSPEDKVIQFNSDRLYVMEQGRIVDSLGNHQPDSVSAKPGSPRYWPPRKNPLTLSEPEPKPEPLQGAYGDLDEPPEDYKERYGSYGKPTEDDQAFFDDLFKQFGDDDDMP